MDGAPEDGGARLIVVGYDDSPGSRAALQWALEEARVHRARLRLVYVSNVPNTIYASFAPIPVGDTALEDEMRQTLESAIASLGGAQDLAIETVAVEGVPAEVIVRHAEDADLIVVGSRGLGGFRGLLLGSVSHQVAQHAHCPVVIVHAPASD